MTVESKIEKNDQELSDEDLQLKQELEMLVERLKESNQKLYKPSLESLRVLIRTSTSSMTSVPKPLKFLREHYPDLKAMFLTWKCPETKLLADILSVLAMSFDSQERESIKYRLLGSGEDAGVWGHEYVR